MRICFVRHGETNWNKAGLIQGQMDIPLNDIGIKQAQLCGEYIAREKWACIATSPLLRARTTAEMIANISSNSNVVIDHDLKERKFGYLEGKRYSDLECLNLELCGIEPECSVKKRMEDAVRRLINMFYPNDIVIVTHGSCLKHYLNMIRDNACEFHLNNGSISQITFDGTECTVDFVNKKVNELLLNK